MASISGIQTVYPSWQVKSRLEQKSKKNSQDGQENSADKRQKQNPNISTPQDGIPHSDDYA